jgi:hypothetical protein
MEALTIHRKDRRCQVQTSNTMAASFTCKAEFAHQESGLLGHDSMQFDLIAKIQQ